MFAKKKTRRLNTNEAVVVVDEGRIHILEFYKRRFVVGLQWETIRATRNLMKEVRRIGKERKLDVVAIRKSDSIQAGFASKTKKKLRGGYSLIVTLASILDGCCIAVIYIGQNEQGEDIYTLVGKTEKGGIHPYSDEIYQEEQLSQVIIDLKSDLRGNTTGMEIPVYGDTDRFDFVTAPLELDVLLNPKNLSKDFRLKPLTWGMTKNQLLALGGVLLFVVLGLSLLNQYNEQQEEKLRLSRKIQTEKLEEINRNARYKAALDKLKHPWIGTPSIAEFLASCSQLKDKLPLSVTGWIPTTVECNSTELSVTLVRPENSAATTKEVVEAIKKIFGVDAKFFFNQTSIVTFSIKNNANPNGDDPKKDTGEQLLKIISLFQGININAVMNAVEIKEVEKNEFGEDLPLQDWQEYTFDVDTNIPPQLIFVKDEFSGMRLNKIIYTVDQGSSTIQYKITGAVYGAR
ncbi:type 4b pilus protein PilO2 [Photorhabdus temperata]|uniref:Pilus assembly protein PilO n=1 Tax=Photorhabdus temperata J3 TaxID=1389415 RepID=U7R4A6_PHOTE|nr:type 4b pilus protein PilO2 [Photorhabdus temperata]ERT14894.1 hypothetical protein O185_01130 [Photorhabdus temperata J3]